MAEKALVQGVRVPTSASQPRGDGGLSKAEDPFSSRRVQPFGQRREHYGDLISGSFQPVERRVAPGSERGAASLTAKRLDVLSLAVLAITNQRMNLSISNAEVQALLVGTGVPIGVDSLGCSRAAFDLAKGGVLVLALALQPTREWRRDDRRSNRLGFVASGDVAARCAWLLLVRRKTEEETSQDAKAAPDRGGDRPQAGPRTHEGPYKTSLLEIGRRESSLRSQDKESRARRQASSCSFCSAHSRRRPRAPAGRGCCSRGDTAC